MSSTDDERGIEAVRGIFQRHMMTLAHRAASDGGLFPLGPEPERQTYYLSRPGRTMSRQDFERPAGDQLEVALSELWKSEGRSSWGDLAGDLAKLARSLRLEEEQTGEVSPFIYVMF